MPKQSTPKNTSIKQPVPIAPKPTLSSKANDELKQIIQTLKEEPSASKNWKQLEPIHQHCKHCTQELFRLRFVNYHQNKVEVKVQLNFDQCNRCAEHYCKACGDKCIKPVIAKIDNHDWNMHWCNICRAALHHTIITENAKQKYVENLDLNMHITH